MQEHAVMRMATGTEEQEDLLSRTNDVYEKGFADGVEHHAKEIRANYDSWMRARERHNMTGTVYQLQELAVRQVIYGNETGTPPHETHEKEKA